MKYIFIFPLGAFTCKTLYYSREIKSSPSLTICIVCTKLYIHLYQEEGKSIVLNEILLHKNQQTIYTFQEYTV
jgi:hypothetical protein